MLAPDEDDSSSCFFDFSLIDQMPVPGDELPSLQSDFHWSSNLFTDSSNLSTGFFESRETGSRKRVNPASCSTSDTKACREKKRRDKLNERFQELNELLDPRRPHKTDKTVILSDAIRKVIQLREEVMKLQDSTRDLQAKINVLKVEKTELRDEKQKLKAEKEKLEQQVKAVSQPHATSTFYPYSQIPIDDGKFVPFMGYHGVPMWPFTPFPAIDTSEDHIHRSPLA